ncbi:MAG: aminopeptidase P family N-terminal domain-containing protein, partial [Nitratireductor sp.]
MFQTFSSSASPQNSKHRIAALRALMKRKKLDWYLVPHSDEHQNEYLPKCAERLEWITAFTGSAGFAMIGLKSAYIFVDGRYTTQVKDQVDLNIFNVQDLVASPPSSFIQTIAKTNHKIGYDPKLLTIGQLAKWEQSKTKTTFTLTPHENLIDSIWDERPPAPNGKVKLHPTKYAGETPSSKIKRVQHVLKADGADAMLMSDPASLAWTFNIRGNDMVHNPLVLGYAIIPAKPNKLPLLFIEDEKLNEVTKKSLSKICKLMPPSKLESQLKQLAKNANIHCDPNLVSSHFSKIIQASKGTLIKKRDPVVLLRAIKNQTEIEGAINAHIRDGVACTKFLHWLDTQKQNTITEIDAVKSLEAFRFNTAKALGSRLEEISFDTISGAGANGAIVHYRVTDESNAVLKNNSLYLVDSGGQYKDGTTDITRTIAIGKPPKSAILDFTLVLKGHIAIAMAKFPMGTRGVDLDVLARMALWQ